MILNPPGPQGNAIFGMAGELRGNPLHFLERLNREYGDAVRFRFFANFYGYLFSHPDHNQRVLVDNHRNYTKEHPSFVLLRAVIGNGLLTNDGDSWLRQRRLIQPAFHARRIAEFGTIMTGCTEDMLAGWTSREDGKVDVAEEMMRLTLRIVCKSLFSIDIAEGDEKGDLSQADHRRGFTAPDAVEDRIRKTAAIVGTEFSYVNRHIAETSSMPFGIYYLKIPFPRNRRFKRAMGALDGVVHDIIEERRRKEMGASGYDLLSLLMAARDESSGKGMDNRQLRDEVMTLMLAGHETTAVLLAWTFYLLSNHPEVETRLSEELERVLGGRVPAMEDLPNLTYTRMVLDEVLRLYPPAYAIGRLADKPDVIGHYSVPARGVVMLSPYLTHRHPDFWEDPEKFDPERFSPERQSQRPRFAYLPFGGGPRQCIGNSFALTEAQLILATVLQRYRLRIIPGYPVEPEPLITLRPRYGLPVKLQRREKYDTDRKPVQTFW